MYVLTFVNITLCVHLIDIPSKQIQKSLSKKIFEQLKKKKFNCADKKNAIFSQTKD